MSWNLEEFKSCFRYGTVFVVGEVISIGDAAVLKAYRLRIKKESFYFQKKPIGLRVDLDTIGSLGTIKVGDLLFRQARDMEVSILRPGVNMPSISIEQVK